MVINRKKVALKKGNVYTHSEDGNEYQIIEFISDSNQVLAKNINTLKTNILSITKLENAVGNEWVSVDLSEVSDEELEEAQRKFDIIKPYLFPISDELKVSVNEIAAKHNIPKRTLYNWISAYERTSSIESLINFKRGWSAGKSRLSKEQEEIINEVIETFFLTEQKPTLEKSYREISRICYKKGLPRPSRDALYRRIKQLNEKVKLEKRGNKKRAKDLHTPKPGEYPSVDAPLQVIQIDHTKIDVAVVDSVNRQSIGRAWLTLAIDVYSRMVTGYYLSLDAPSATSVAMCVARSILPKNALLAELGLKSKWDVFGYPNKIYVDNGKDFHSKAFTKACAIHEILLEYRPVKVPHYGAHIERLMGTFKDEVHTLPGTTFSNIFHKGEYDSERNAVLTLDELEKWLVTFITDVYHKRIHSGIDKPPEAQWNIGIYGDGVNHGMGIPPFPQDARTLFIDFLPGEERTVQHVGVTMDGLTYYDPCLNIFINKKNKQGKNEKFIFKRDPRDISRLYFYDPILKQYFDVPFANPRLPPISLWEYLEVRKRIKERGEEYVNEQQIYDGIERMRAIVQESSEKTKKARRAAQRTKSHSTVRKIIDNTIINHSNIKDSSSSKNEMIVESDQVQNASAFAGLSENINFSDDDLDID